MIRQLIKLFKRRNNAYRLGINFNRSADFCIPKNIIINDVLKNINVPNEHGIKISIIEILLDDCYGLNFLKKTGVKINTILDIGANVGIFGVASRIHFPRAKIHSYEPNNKLESYLSNQAQIAEFQYFLEAVGLKKEMISLDFNEDSVQTRSVQDNNGNISKTSFKEAIKRLGGKVDLLKIDCEGGEWEIFEDFESWKKIGNLSMEYHLFNKNQTEELVKSKIKKLGFKITSFESVENYGLLIAKRNI